MKETKQRPCPFHNSPGRPSGQLSWADCAALPWLTTDACASASQGASRRQNLAQGTRPGASPGLRRCEKIKKPHHTMGTRSAQIQIKLQLSLCPSLPSQLVGTFPLRAIVDFRSVIASVSLWFNPQNSTGPMAHNPAPLFGNSGRARGRPHPTTMWVSVRSTPSSF